MKCLTEPEIAAWLDSLSVRRGKGNSLCFAGEMKKIMSTVPKTFEALHSMSNWLSEWWTDSERKLIVLSDWQDYPPDQYVVFEKIRNGCGEFRLISDAPGHLFDGSSEQDKALFAGIIFHIIAFSWFGFIASETGKQFLGFGDESIELFANEPEIIMQVHELITIFKLQEITDVKDAWASKRITEDN